MEINNFLKSPAAWSWTLAIYLFISNTTKIIVILAPIVLITSIANVDGTLSINGLEKAFSECAKGAALTMGLKESTVRPILIYSAIVSLPFIVSAPFIGIRRNWARILVVLLLVADISMPIVVYIAEARGSVTFNTIVNIAILIFLLLPSTIAQFKKVHLE